MEKLLNDYLILKLLSDRIFNIMSYDIDGSICKVKVEIDGEYDYMTVNMWDVLVFMNERLNKAEYNLGFV